MERSGVQKVTRKAKRLSAVMLSTAAFVAVLLLPACGQSKDLPLHKASSASARVVKGDSSYKGMTRPYRLKVFKCTRAEGGAADCLLKVKAPTPCDLKGGAGKGQVCIEVISYRYWKVHVNGSGKAKIAAVADSSSTAVPASIGAPFAN